MIDIMSLFKANNVRKGESIPINKTEVSVWDFNKKEDT